MLCLHMPYTTNHEVWDCPIRVPPKPHTAVRSRHSVREAETARAALRPVRTARLIQERFETSFVFGFRRNVRQQLHRNARDWPHLNFPVKDFCSLGLNLDLPAVQPHLVSPITIPRMSQH